MKAEQSSVYRNLELLHLWCLETFENMPKNAVLREDLHILLENIIQAQSATSVALNTPNLKQRFDLLDVVVMSMTNIKSITKVLTRFSSEKGTDNKTVHIIAKNQRIAMLDIMTKIGNGLGSWRNNTLSLLESNAAKIPD